MRRTSNSSSVTFMPGKYAEAAKVYKKSGYTSYAMNMYTDLRMFDLAKVGIQHQVTMLFSYIVIFLTELNESRVHSV